jgi:hypothetical protein
VRIVLIGCGKLKNYRCDKAREGRVLPAELYSSELFRKRVAYARHLKLPWYVASAKYGLWSPDVAIDPRENGEIYNTAMEDLTASQKAVWHAQMAHSIGKLLNGKDPSELTVEIHTGRKYAHPLVEMLQLMKIKVEMPVDGLSTGYLLEWYLKAVGGVPSKKKQTTGPGFKLTEVSEMTHPQKKRK